MNYMSKNRNLSSEEQIGQQAVSVHFDITEQCHLYGLRESLLVGHFTALTGRQAVTSTVTLAQIWIV